MSTKKVVTDLISNKIFFGNAQTCPAIPKTESFVTWCENRRTTHHLSSLVFLTQTHSVTVVDIDYASQKLELFKQTGDALITNLKNVGLGILTADCLPVVIHDPLQNVVGVAHIGWRGAVGGIIHNLIHAMTTTYACQPQNLRVTFGPSARACCYQVSPNFVQSVFDTTHIKQRNDSFFFDNLGYVQSQLQKHRIRKHHVNDVMAACTICDQCYYSYRRNSSILQRQATITWL